MIFNSYGTKMRETDNSGIEHVMKNVGITAFVAAALTSCISNGDQNIQTIDMKAKGPAYGVNIQPDNATVHFDINAGRGKGIDYAIRIHKDNKGEIEVKIKGKTTYEDLTNAKINKTLKYVNEIEFEKNFPGDAESAIKEGWDKLIGDIIPGGIDFGDERMKDKDKKFKELSGLVNNVMTYNTIKGDTDTIVSRKGNSIETTIAGKTMKFINDGFSVTKGDEKADVYVVIADKKEIGNIVLAKSDLLTFTKDLKEELAQYGIDAPSDAEICGIWNCLK